jgi:hypothetical protein
MNYYILENEDIVESRWEKEPGERHLDSKVKSVATKGEFDRFVSEQALKMDLEIKQHNKEVRNINKIADLWLMGTILNSGSDLGIDIEDTITVMKELAPGSFRELKKYIKTN